MNNAIRARRGSRACAWAIVVLAVLAAGAGVLDPGLYRDNGLVTAAWFGNDLATLVGATPPLVASLWLGPRSARARLVGLGLLLYMLYNFQFYLFGAAFNALFLTYVGLFLFSILGLGFGLAATDASALAARVRGGPRSRTVAAWMAVVAALLGTFWVGSSIRYWFTGAVPYIVEATSHRTNVTGALDLSLVVGLGALAGHWLWRGEPWGFVLAVAWNVKGALYMFALSLASITAWRLGPAEDAAPLMLWVPIGFGCAVSAWSLLRRLDPQPGDLAVAGSSP